MPDGISPIFPLSPTSPTKADPSINPSWLSSILSTITSIGTIIKNAFSGLFSRQIITHATDKTVKNRQAERETRRKMRNIYLISKRDTTLTDMDDKRRKSPDGFETTAK